MIKNKIKHWRSRMNGGKGVSQAELARQVGVGRSFVTKLEKGTGQPGAELMLRLARVLKRPVEVVFQHVEGEQAKPSIICAQVIPDSQTTAFMSAPAKLMCHQLATPPARPAGLVSVKDKSPVSPAAKAVASPVAQLSQRKQHETK